jgi:hypothetical protein
MHISIIVAARMLANKSASEAPLDCCTALNPLKAIACQIPARFSTNRRIHSALHNRHGTREILLTEHCRYGTRRYPHIVFASFACFV